MDCHSSDDLPALESRIQKLEKLLYSTDLHHCQDRSIIPTLTSISRKAQEAENSNNNLKKISSQLADLEKFATICHADTLEKPSDAKVAFIEASERELRQEAKHLENVDKLKWVLDSEHLKTRITADLNVKLLQISQRQSEQREEVAERLDRSKDLVDNYNKAIGAISSQFAKWNTIVTRLEEQQQIVKE